MAAPSSQTPVAAPGFVPGGHPFLPPSAADATGALLREDRRPLDSRRLRAAVIDDVLTVPVALALVAILGDPGLLLAMAIAMTYRFLCEATTGQTIGKRVAKLRVVSVDGTRPRRRDIATRNVLRYLEGFLFLGLILYVASGPRRQRPGDRAAHTIVVDAARVATPRRAIDHRLALFPAAWLVAAGIFTALEASAGDTLVPLSRADICTQLELAGGQYAAGTPAGEAQLRDAQLEILAEVSGTWDAGGRQAQLIARLRRERDELRRLAAGNREITRRDDLRMQEMRRMDSALLAAQGYESCERTADAG